MAKGNKSKKVVNKCKCRASNPKHLDFCSKCGRPLISNSNGHAKPRKKVIGERKSQMNSVNAKK